MTKEFWRYWCSSMNKIEHDFKFDPTCGYTQDQLLKITPPDNEPADFRAFWEEAYDRAMSMPLNIVSIRQIWSPNPDTEIFEVHYKSWDDAVIGAWLNRPKKSSGGILYGYGYGNPSTPILDDDFTVITPCLRGMGMSKHPEIPWLGHQHVLHGIESRETYVLLGCAVDLWLATSVMTEIYPDTAANIHYRGGSFGGGMGALAVPWDKRIRSAYLNVPTFGHNPLRLQFESTGSGESVRVYRQTHPECDAVLPYFDAAIAAGYFRVPVLVTPALFDPAVLPPGQFAVTNAIPEQFREVYIYPAGHYEVPENVPVREKVDVRKQDYSFNRAPEPGIHSVE